MPTFSAQFCYIQSQSWSVIEQCELETLKLIWLRDIEVEQRYDDLLLRLSLAELEMGVLKSATFAEILDSETTYNEIYIDEN